MRILLRASVVLSFLSTCAVSAFSVLSTAPPSRRQQSALRSSSIDAAQSRITELPDSLEDSARIAAEACKEFSELSGMMAKCRIDFDTSAGDETYTLLKSSTEFMQAFVSATSYAMVPGLQEQRQNEMMKVAQARVELQAIMQEEEMDKEETDQSAETETTLEAKEEIDSVDNGKEKEEKEEKTQDKSRKEELIEILQNGGRDPSKPAWEGPKVRVYFPDEGSAALARRDWNPKGTPDQALVPPCVEFSSCGGLQRDDVSNDMIVFFFCPKASESDSVEELLLKTETAAAETLKLTVFVNPNLVDMGVTGFGLAGRRLRERLIDGLVDVYYLRTLSWGALTRVWPKEYSVWQEDANAEGGYKLLRSYPRQPAIADVEVAYDIANGDKDAPRSGGGPLHQLGDFVNGMMRL